MSPSSPALAASLLLAALAQATSVGVGEHECPICERELKTTRVMSYSQFGEPARDLSDLPRYTLFGSPESCPWDLYTAFSDGWEIEDPDELASMKRFLTTRPLAIQLTPAEAELLGDAPLPSSIRSLLWARTCNLQRKPNPARDRDTALLLFYNTRHPADASTRRWNHHFRSEAIKTLDAHAKDPGITAVERSIFTYLAGELRRQADDPQGAKTNFAEARELANKSKSKDDAWIERWAQEQTLLIDVEGVDSGELDSWLIRPLPNPWGESEKVEALAEMAWTKHKQALDTLLERATTRNDTKAEAILWKSIGQDPAALLALAETSPEDAIEMLPKGYPHWAEWFQRIAETVDKDAALKALLANERNRNILGRVVGFQRAPWQDDPKVKSMLRDACQSNDPTQWLEKLSAFEKRDVLGEVMDAMENDDLNMARNAARLAVHMLKELDADPKLANYPVSYLLADLCEDRKKFSKAVQPHLSGTWKTPFWKACVTYASGNEKVSQELLSSPLRKQHSREDGMVFDHLLYQMLEAAGDPALVPDCIKELETKDWLASEIQSYAMAIDDKRLTAALLQRLEWLHHPQTKKHEAYSMLMEGEALDIESHLFTEKLEALPTVVAAP
ncbi:hypothetical protein [Haloferula rosea]|uniref:HEAT repeat domain-containing protein n=1 Tax=Haloferula rosea TaxID=490093 RepID=A0A934VHP3_9BACT|nr:hypothetical protein [Haloferula rosea]MBK1828890.1 hypothetical protein [Haloferula rosea]